MDSGSSVTWGRELACEPPLHLLQDKARAVGSARPALLSLGDGQDSWECM